MWGRTSSASGVYEASEERSLSIQLADRAPDCTLQPGTGRAMVANAVERRGGRLLDIGGSPAAAAAPTERGASVVIWLSDRCTVSLSGPGQTIEALERVARDLDLKPVLVSTGLFYLMVMMMQIHVYTIPIAIYL